VEEKDRDRRMGFSVVCLHGRWGEKQKKKEWGGGGEARRHLFGRKMELVIG